MLQTEFRKLAQGALRHMVHFRRNHLGASRALSSEVEYDGGSPRRACESSFCSTVTHPYSYVGIVVSAAARSAPSSREAWAAAALTA